MKITKKQLMGLTKIWIELYLFYYVLGAVAYLLIPCIYSKYHREKLMLLLKKICAKSSDMLHKCSMKLDRYITMK